MILKIPQMMPLNWMLLYLYFLLIIMLMMVILSFMKMYSLDNLKSLELINKKMYFKWKW